MRQLIFILFFSFSFIKAVGQEQFYPSLSSMMSTLYKIDSSNFRVSIDGGDSFGEWKSWPNKFIYTAFENTDSSIIIADTFNKSAAKYKFNKIEEFDNSSRNIYYEAKYHCHNEDNYPFVIEFIKHAGIDGYQIIATSISPPGILSIKYFVKFDRYYKGKWIEALLR